MRIWLCDDEEVERSYLAALVEEWAKAQGVPLQLYLEQIKQGDKETGR